MYILTIVHVFYLLTTDVITSIQSVDHWCHSFSVFIGSRGSSWPWSYGSWIYNYLCNQCLSPLMLWVWILIRVRCTALCDKVCQWLATGRWFSPGPLVSSTNKTDRHDIIEMLLKVTLNTIKQTNIIGSVYSKTLSFYLRMICWYGFEQFACSLALWLKMTSASTKIW
jgi:hypothetical protein